MESLKIKLLPSGEFWRKVHLINGLYELFYQVKIKSIKSSYDVLFFRDENTSSSFHKHRSM